MPDFLGLLGTRVLVCDGAMGTVLHAQGHSYDGPLAQLSVSNPALVSAIHESYVQAGVDIIQTNSFGASRHRLAAHGYGDKVREINLAAVSVAREVASAGDRTVFVGGSVSPTVTVASRNKIRPAERVGALREQIEALAEGGVDLLVLETFGYLAELIEAVETAAEVTAIPIVAQATFARDQRMFSGETPEEAAKALSALPVAVVGTNCTVGPSGVFDILSAMATSTSLPLIGQPNAGLIADTATGPDGAYQLDPEYFCDHSHRFVSLGAAIVGGCCGTAPNHLRALVEHMRGGPPPVPTRQVTAPVARRNDARWVGERRRRLPEMLGGGHFVVAVEVEPPLGGMTEDTLDHIRDLPALGVEHLFIAPASSPRAQVSALSFALHVQQHVDVRATLTTTTWDKSVITLQADMLGAFGLGIESVVCELGAPPLHEDYPRVDGIWEIDEFGLLDLLTRLNAGRDWDDTPLRTETSFTIGARCNPAAADLHAELARTRAKIEAGAQFLVTRPVYEADSVQRFIDGLESSLPLIAAVHPLRSLAEAEVLRNEVAGTLVPDSTIRRLRRSGAAGTDLAGELVEGIAPLVAGVVVTDADPLWLPPLVEGATRLGRERVVPLRPE